MRGSNDWAAGCVCHTDNWSTWITLVYIDNLCISLSLDIFIAQDVFNECIVSAWVFFTSIVSLSSSYNSDYSASIENEVRGIEKRIKSSHLEWCHCSIFINFARVIGFTWKIVAVVPFKSILRIVPKELLHFIEVEHCEPVCKQCASWCSLCCWKIHIQCVCCHSSLCDVKGFKTPLQQFWNIL